MNYFMSKQNYCTIIYFPNIFSNRNKENTKNHESFSLGLAILEINKTAIYEF